MRRSTDVGAHRPREAWYVRTTNRQVVHVRQDRRGGWEVSLSRRREPLRLETFDDARRVAYLSVAHRHPCELVIQDAYHRVVERELIDGVES
jgi:hypothetical protein